MVIESRPDRPARRRWLAALACCIGAGAAAAEPATFDAWIDLDAPVAADAPDAQTAQAWQARVVAQQDELARRLRALGAVELARVQHARNAMAVRLPQSQADAVRGLAGVVRLRPLDVLHPPRTQSDPRPPR